MIDIEKKRNELENRLKFYGRLISDREDIRGDYYDLTDEIGHYLFQYQELLYCIDDVKKCDDTLRENIEQLIRRVGHTNNTDKKLNRIDMIEVIFNVRTLFKRLDRLYVQVAENRPRLNLK